MLKQNMFFIIILTFATLNLNAQEVYNQFDTNGKRHGKWQKTFEGSKHLRYQGEFSHGKEIGLFKFYKLYRGKSVLSATKLFNPENSIAEVTYLSSRGKTISTGKMDGKLHIGTWQYFHEKTKDLMTEEQYNSQGLLDGEKRTYYSAKKLAEVLIFKNGKKEGVSTWYAEEGTKLKEFTYENDQLHGPAKFYDANEKIAVEGQYKRDKKTGYWKYYKDGELYDEKDFTYYAKYKKKQ